MDHLDCIQGTRLLLTEVGLIYEDGSPVLTTKTTVPTHQTVLLLGLG